MPNDSELMPWHKTYLTDIEYNRVDLVKEGANSKAHIKLFKSKGGNTMDLETILKSLKPEHADVVSKAFEAKEQEMLDAVEKAKKDAAAAAADAKKKNADDGDPEDKSDGGSDDSIEKVLKTVKDPAVRAILETQIAKTKAAEEVAKIMKAKQDQTEAEAIAKTVPNIGAEEATLIDVYKKLKNVDESLCTDVFGIFKAASALAKQGGAFVEIGKGAGNGTGEVASGDEAAAWGQIEAAADAIAKSANIKKSAAISQVIKERPELYNAYIKAQQGN